MISLDIWPVKLEYENVWIYLQFVCFGVVLFEKTWYDTVRTVIWRNLHEI
jgi:hypothetical protein